MAARRNDSILSSLFGFGKDDEPRPAPRAPVDDTADRLLAEIAGEASKSQMHRGELEVLRTRTFALWAEAEQRAAEAARLRQEIELCEAQNEAAACEAMRLRCEIATCDADAQARTEAAGAVLAEAEAVRARTRSAETELSEGMALLREALRDVLDRRSEGTPGAPLLAARLLAAPTGSAVRVLSALLPPYADAAYAAYMVAVADHALTRLAAANGEDGADGNGDGDDVENALHCTLAGACETLTQGVIARFAAIPDPIVGLLPATMTAVNALRDQLRAFAVGSQATALVCSGVCQHACNVLLQHLLTKPALCTCGVGVGLQSQISDMERCCEEDEATARALCRLSPVEEAAKLLVLMDKSMVQDEAAAHSVFPFLTASQMLQLLRNFHVDEMNKNAVDPETLRVLALRSKMEQPSPAQQ